jgi:CheY-like chemotaxis protein
VKLQFGLLWIEDNFSEQEEEEIRTGAADAGFELEITNSKDGSNLESLAEHQAKFHAFDLILLDLKLAGGVLGDQLAPRVRELFRSTPILFYSGSESENDLRNRMAKERIEGVYCAHRVDGTKFTTRAGELIQDYAHTLNRLSGMRGLAMEVVAEVDVICREIILKLAVGKAEKTAVDFLDKAVCDQSKANLEKFPALVDVPQRIDHPATDSMKSFALFRELLRKHIASLPNGEAKDNLSALRSATRDYRESVLHVRNVLGHALETRNDKGWLILDRNGKPFMTIDDFPGHRSTFLSQLRAVRQIFEILIPKN